MLRYFLRTRWRDYISWGCLILLTIIWFLADQKQSEPPVITENTLFMINISYGTDFTSMADAVARLPAFMVYRFFNISAFRFNGSQILISLFSSLLLARHLGNPAATQPLWHGRSRTAYALLLSAMFYLTMILLQGVQFLLHLLQMGFACFPLMDWGQLLHLFLLHSLYLCGFVSITAFFAFATQSMLFTTLASMGLLIALRLLQSTALLSYTPVYYSITPALVPPYNDAILMKGVLVSVVWILVFTVASCVVYSRRDIRTE